MTTEKLKKFYNVVWNLSESFTTTFGNFGDKLQIILPIIPILYFLGEHLMYLFFGICPNGLILGICGFTLGVLCGFSRIVNRAHWSRDVCTSIGVSLFAFFIASFFMI